MELEGTVHGGVIVPDGTCSLPEGSRVRIRVVQQNGQTENQKEGPTIVQKLRKLAEKYERLPCDLPDDYAINHDHYLHGLPKRP
jgi:hypothetical protein